MLPIVISISISIVLLILWRIRIKQKNKLINYHIGDIICLTNNKLNITNLAIRVHPLHQPLAELIKWDSKEVLLKLADETYWFVKHKNVKNLSYNTRTVINEMDKWMSAAIFLSKSSGSIVSELSTSTITGTAFAATIQAQEAKKV